MSRNTNSHFALNPTRLDISRSRFNRSSSYKTTFNTGELIPFYVDEVLPGDTFSVRTSKVVRMQTLIAPIMDSLYLDTYYFFVPNRIVWAHWRELMGENSKSAWYPDVQYSVPQISAPEGGWEVGTVADYFGLPTGVSNISVSALPFRAYALICNEWFRDENLLDPLNVPVTDSDVTGTNGDDYVTDVVLGGKPFKVAKYHDYFTSALPSPQKGPDVSLPLATGTIPVWSTTDVHSMADAPSNIDTLRAILPGATSSGTFNLIVENASPSTTASHFVGANASNIGSNTMKTLYPSNLNAVLDGGLSSVTINQLRTAFQVQKMYERDARGGTRYIEILKSHFGVTSPDARLQRPEYLGGKRMPINIQQVVQTSATQTSGLTPQGNLSAYSLTSDTERDFTKSFVEHGFVIGVMCVRYPHSYQQGIERFWSRKDRLDYYWPVFANLGEMSILNKEIYAQGTDEDNEVFGYQEAWADYRYKPSRVTGEMRSSYKQSLDIWHLADDYSALPSLSPQWISEDSETVNRVIAVSDQVSDQFFCDIFIENKCSRAMPVYSIPGLVDHH